MSLPLLHNKSSHSLGWWHHCLSATHVGSLLWPVLGARRHPWIWLLFHRLLAGEFRQVCIPDRIYIQNGDSTAISGSLKPYVVWLDTEKHLRNGLPLCSMRRLAGQMFTTSCQFLVGAVIGVQVHRPLRICLRSLVCSKVLTHLDAGSCSGLLLIHAGL